MKLAKVKQMQKKLLHRTLWQAQSEKGAIVSTIQYLMTSENAVDSTCTDNCEHAKSACYT
jgi:hypothetical protein